MDSPKVSLIIPTYNMGATLPVAIDSALSQQCESLEIIVADDGSTDNTQEILKQYSSDIIVLQLKHGNRSTALNAGLAAARGEYFAALDADDTLPQQSIAVRANFLDEHPEINGVFADTAYYSNGLLYDIRAPSIEFLNAQDKSEALAFASRAPTTMITWMYRTTAARNNGGWNRKAIRIEDLEFTYRFLQKNNAGYVPETVYNYNTSTHNITSRVRNRLHSIYANRILAQQQDNYTSAAKLLLWRCGLDVAKLAFELVSPNKNIPELQKGLKQKARHFDAKTRPAP